MVVTRHRAARSGFTLLELTIGASLLALVAYQTWSVMRSASRYSRDEVSSITVQRDAEMVLDRIAYSILSANREFLSPEKDSPLHSSEIRYQGVLGIQNGNVIWGDPEDIGLERGNQVVWRQNPATEAERRVVWCKSVREFLEREVLNGKDDNGNGLVDERGLSFAIEGNKVTVVVCLERRTRDGQSLTETVSTTVTCRNLGG